MKLSMLLVARRDLEREALAAILTDAGLEIGVHDPTDALSRPSDLSLAQYQLALIDARMADSLAEAAWLLASAPTIKIALMVECAATDLIRSAFASGVAGIVDRGVSCATLVRQLELLALGGCVVPSGFIETLTTPQAPAPSGTTAAAVKRLSIREREIVRCIATGMSNKVIARELQLSEPTVKVHVGAILRKLNFANRTKVAVWAACLGAMLTPSVIATRAPTGQTHSLNRRPDLQAVDAREMM
jgi:two-component system nitrate/nitrite response regulator NarL